MRRFCQVVAVATIFAGGGMSSDGRHVGSWKFPTADVRPVIVLFGGTALATCLAWRFARVMNDEPRKR